VFWIVGGVALALVIGLAVPWMTAMPDRSHRGPLASLSATESLVRDRLRRHVSVLAVDIGERHVWRGHSLADSAVYLETVLRDLGYVVERQRFEARGVEVLNVEAELAGAAPNGVVVVGAHYDSVIGTVGANDNASGVAAMLELARLLAGRRLPGAVRFVGFVNEEPPFFLTGEMGSRRYARHCRERGDRVVAMLSLETLGCYSDRSGSQSYPFPFGLLYPRTGNFIGFVGNLRSRGLVRRSVRAFRQAARFPSEGVAAPGYLPGIFWSDHWSFWREGYPAVMVTDTALFRSAYYHTTGDTPEKIDFDRMARVVVGLAAVVERLADAGSRS
jgi:Zn-dependent M28 family amino/carboxypeptidase